MGLFGFLGETAGILIGFIRDLAPWIVKVIGASLRKAWDALVGYLKAIIPNSEAVAEDWTSEFFNQMEFPTRYDYIVRYIFLAVAIITHVALWIILSFVTIWIFRAIF